MSKYLYVDGGGVADFAAVVFEDEFKGDRLELWNESNKAGKALEYDDGVEIYFEYEAMELDDSTVEQIQSRMDYDESKDANYFRVEG